ncbi:hypothetical protein [Candidatus Symbiothrix dinenymphae]|uniref:hypothetical protein n=1 Tax=Candidatus Symbiothrix dinenymphae TaxID=467085 RepID=UPI001315A027|nr:hypothetical protein [Candidatus Symbiothrix dinenymphae]
MMGNEHYSVKKVNTETFNDDFKELLSLKDEGILQKSLDDTHIFRYLSNYLVNKSSGANITTIVVEEKYTCLNFLEDYANYYARCYTPYKKECKRLHFFSGVAFSEEGFEAMLMNWDHDNWKKYQGCIVVKPIPKGIFGVTYLNHYNKIHENDENEKGKLRHYKCLTNQTVNLFGRDCLIQTMPFKEQDGIVASCATTAMWMAFHKTAELFHTKAPSLSEITILAGENEDSHGKIFPSHGLRVSQVCKAINNLGMLAEIKTNFESLSYFNLFVHAYLQGDIPILFGFNFDDAKDANHLVTLNGYRYNAEKYQNFSNRFVSDAIDRFYVHDDQIGTFARIKVDEKPVKKLNQNSDEPINAHLDVTTGWWRDKEEAQQSTDNCRHATPAYFIVPLSSSIKVSFDDIYDKFLFIRLVSENFINLAGEGENIPVKNNITWNIFIMKNNDYKKWLYTYFKTHKNENTILNANVDVMQLSLPKYIWVVQAFFGRELLFDFIFDTVETNIYGKPISVNIYNHETEEVLEKGGGAIVNSFASDSKQYNESLLKKLNQEIKISPSIKESWGEIAENE